MRISDLVISNLQTVREGPTVNCPSARVFLQLVINERD